VEELFFEKMVKHQNRCFFSLYWTKEKKQKKSRTNDPDSYRDRPFGVPAHTNSYWRCKYIMLSN